MNLYQKYIQEKDPARRRKLIFKKYSSAHSLVLFCEILKNDPSPVLRHEAAFLLGVSMNKKALPVLLDACIKDSSALVRHEALEAIGDLGIRNEKVKKILKQLCTNKNPFIKDTAEIALSTLYNNK